MCVSHLCVKLEDRKKNYVPGPEAITCCHTPGCRYNALTPCLSQNENTLSVIGQPGKSVTFVT